MLKIRGKTGVIEHGGGNLAIHPNEAISFQDGMVVVEHGDLYQTQTLLPIFTVRMIRWHDKEMERKHGHNKAHGEYSRQEVLEAADVIELEEIREIENFEPEVDRVRPHEFEANMHSDTCRVCGHHLLNSIHN